ncbi:MAG: RNA polymerase sigma factor [Pseudomonadota bacterium]
MVQPIPLNRALRVVKAPAHASLDDDALLAGLANRDPALGAELCHRLMHVVDGTLYRVLGGRESDHDDLVQVAFEQIVLSIQRGKFAGECSLATWASAITFNVALRAIRSRRAERKVFDASKDVEALGARVSGPRDPEAQLSSRNELDRLRHHLSQMSDKLAETLVLHDMLGCDLAETAKVVGASVAATQSRLVRGRKDLTARIQQDREAALQQRGATR